MSEIKTSDYKSRRQSNSHSVPQLFSLASNFHLANGHILKRGRHTSTRNLAENPVTLTDWYCFDPLQS